MNLDRIALSLLALITLISCDAIFPDKTTPTPTEVFDELWEGINQKYVCFSNRDVDWDAVYTKYRRQISDDTNENQLFSILCRMLGELKDGHVSLKMEDRKWSGYQEDSIMNKKPWLVSLYLGEDVKTSGSLSYNTIHDETIGYIEYDSFKDELSDDMVYDALDYCKDCQGLILDLRRNSGGSFPNLVTLLKYLPCEKELFRSFVRRDSRRDVLFEKGVSLLPDIKDESKIWRKPLIVLIDNASYSATSTFAMCVKGCLNVCIVGVKTAGGTCIPTSYELSNGWIYRIPSIKLISRSGFDYEDGVLPDVEIHLDKERLRKYEDSIIEAACEIIESQAEGFSFESDSSRSFAL
jgi:hypothetical protein